MSLYRKKPVVIEAMQLTADNHQAVAAWCGPRVWVDLTAALGDWVIKDVQGEFYPCPADIFRELYEPVSDDA